ncbi:MAG: TonB-dependent receptor [Panacibacter sp.]
MKKICLLATLLCAAVFGFGQNNHTRLSGKIISEKTGAPLAGASIIIADLKQGATSDRDGNYFFSNVPAGHVLLEISYSGFKTIVTHLDITGNTTKDFALSSTIIENEAVTVTAVGAATTIRKAPISISRVNKEQLLSAPSTNIIDALSKQPGVSQITTGPAISKPVIRGLGYNRLVVINDGLRQEGQQWGDEHGIEIDENSVSRIEVVKGPASLIYGSDALAGVINIITTTSAPENSIKGNVLTSYGTNNKQRSLFGSIGGNQHGFDWSAWGDYIAAADYKNKYDGRVLNSKFNERNFGGYAGYHGSWGYSHLVLSSFNQKLGLIEGERFANGGFIKPLAGGIDGTPGEQDFNSTDPSVPYQHIRHTKIISDNSIKAGSGRLSVNLGLQRNQRMEFGNPDDPFEKSLYFDLRTFNYNIAYHFHDQNGWNSSIGLNGMAQSNSNKGEEALIPEYRLFDVGGYVYLQKTKDQLTWSGGVRFDNRSLHSKAFTENNEVKFNNFQRNFANVTASAGLSYAPSTNATFKLNLARGFRAPGIPELASNGQHEGTNRYEYGEQNLKSEISWQGDAGYEVNGEHVYFTTSIFYNAINNFIFYNKLKAPDGSDSLVNGTPAYKFAQRNASLAGAEATLDIHPHPLDWLHWQNTFSYVQAMFKEAIEGTRNVPLIPATRLISQLKAEILSRSNDKTTLSVFAEWDHTFDQKKAFTAFDTETATAGYSLINAGISTNIRKAGKTLFSVYLLAANITDKAYQNHLSRLKYADENLATGRQGVFNTGRNIVLKLNIPLDVKTGKN